MESIITYKFGAAFRASFAQHIPAMVGHGICTDGKPVGNLFGAEAIGNEVKNLHFAQCQFWPAQFNSVFHVLCLSDVKMANITQR